MISQALQSCPAASRKKFNIGVATFLTLAAITPSHVKAVPIVTVSFDGTFTSTGTVYGEAVTSGVTPISGSFSYDLASSGTPSGFSEDYPQSIPNGLSLSFGSTLVTSSNYNVLVENNTSIPRDSIGVSVPDVPSFGDAILISWGEFTGGLFSDTSLPSSFPSLSSFTAQTNILFDNSTGSSTFTVNSISVNSGIVPEPSTLTLSALGILALIRRRRRN